MDRAEYKERMARIDGLLYENRYEEALDLLDSINWRKLHNVNFLLEGADRYEKLAKPLDARELLEIAHERSPVGRMIIYRLALLTATLGDIEVAKSYYQKFIELAPNDNLRYIIKYTISKLQGADDATLISILEELRSNELLEQWAYELACLYQRTGQIDKCLNLLDEIILWFGDGPYVEKAFEIKLLYRPLSKDQEIKYRHMVSKGDSIIEIHPGERAARDEYLGHTIRIPEIEETKEKYNTQNLQAEIRKNIEDIMKASEMGQVSENIEAIKELVEDIPYLQMDEEEENIEKRKSDTQRLDAQLKSKFQEFLAEEFDGQITIMETGHEDPEQIDGQMSIDDVMERWEKTRRAAEQALLEAKEQELNRYKEQAIARASGVLDRLIESEKAPHRGPYEQDVFVPEALATDIHVADQGPAIYEPDPVLSEEALPSLADESLSVPESLLWDLHQVEFPSISAMEIRPVVFPDVTSMEISDETLPSIAEESFGYQGSPELEILDETLYSIADESLDYENLEYADIEISDETLYSIADESLDHTGLEYTDLELSDETLYSVADESLDYSGLDYTDIEISDETLYSIAEESLLIPDSFAVEDYPEEPDVEYTLSDESLFIPLWFTAESLEKEHFGLELFPSDYTLSEESLSIPDGFTDDIRQEMGAQRTFSIPRIAAVGELSGVGFEIPIISAAEAHLEERPAYEHIPGIEEDDDQGTLDWTPAKPAMTSAEDALKNINDMLQKEIDRYSENDASKDTMAAQGLANVGGTSLVSESPKAPVMGNTTANLPLIDISNIASQMQTALTDRERQVLSYFASISGMDGPLISVLYSTRESLKTDGPRDKGHFIIQGRDGSGKTQLAQNIIKVMQEETGKPIGNIGRISGDKLNEKDIRVLFDKVRGGCLIVEHAGKITRETIVSLTLAMENDPSGILVILEDAREDIDRLLSEDPRFAKKFTGRISIPDLMIDELVAFGKRYAAENGYSIDEMGVLALYDRINIIGRPEKPAVVGEVKLIIDEAINAKHAPKFNGIFGIFGNKGNKDSGVPVLQERDFRQES